MMSLLTAVVLLASAPCAAAELRWHPTLAEAKAESRLEKKPIYLYLMADWCPPCKELQAQVHETDAGKRLLSRFALVQVNVDALDRWNYEGFSTSDIPTVFLLDQRGREKARLVHYKDAAEHLASLKAFLAGADAEAYLARRSSAAAAEALSTTALGRGRYEEAAALAEPFRVSGSTAARAQYRTMRFMQVTARFNAEPADHAGVVREADRFLTEFSTASPFAASVSAYRARSLLALGRRDEAVAAVAGLPGAYPASSQSYWRLVEFSRLHRVLDEQAESAIAEALRRFPTQHYPAYQAALWYESRGRKREARAALRRAAELDPSSSFYRSLLERWR